MQNKKKYWRWYKRRKARSRYKKKALRAKPKKQRRRCRCYIEKRPGNQGVKYRSLLTSWLELAGIGQRQQLWKKDRSGNLGNIGQGECGLDSADSEDDDTDGFGDLSNGLDWNYLADWNDNEILWMMGKEAKKLSHRKDQKKLMVNCLSMPMLRVLHPTILKGLKFYDLEVSLSNQVTEDVNVDQELENRNSNSFKVLYVIFVIEAGLCFRKSAKLVFFKV